MNEYEMKTSSGFGIAALVLSICGFMTGFLKIGVFLDIVALVLAMLVFWRAKKQPTKTGLASASIIIATISLVLCFLIFGNSWIKVFYKNADEGTETLDPRITIAVELPDETQIFTDATGLIDTYFENEVRNEDVYINHRTILTTVSVIEKIDTETKRVTILQQSGLIEFANVTLENGCRFSYNIENDDMREFVEKLSVGDEVVLSGYLGEITHISVTVIGFNYYSETAYNILCGNGSDTLA